MRGDEEHQDAMIVFESLEDQVPLNHPLRPIRRMVDRALSEMSPLFDSLYAERGRVSIPPECLLRAQVLQILYAIPSERKFCEHLQYHLLFRWFVGLPFSQAAWHPTSFTKNRDRLLTSEVAGIFFEKIRSQAEAKKLLSKEHFSVDGTLIEAAASLKSFRPKAGSEGDDGEGPTGGGRNPEVDFRGERRRNDTHASRTDPDARLARIKGKEAKLSYRGHLLVENRHGLIVDCALTHATGTAEEEAALALLDAERRRQRGPMTVGADRGYNTKRFVGRTRALRVTPHVAEKRRYSAIDGRTTSWEGYQVSQRRRKIVEEPFGWMKTVGGLRKLRHRGEEKVRAVFTLTCACFNLVRLRNLGAELCPA
ncbi:MAG: IS5 family transposase [Thermoleophilia bacterium]